MRFARAGKRSWPLIALLLVAGLSGCRRQGNAYLPPASRGEPEKRQEGPVRKRKFADFHGVWVDSQSFSSFRNSASVGDLKSTRPVDLTLADTSLMTWGYHEGIVLVPDALAGDSLHLTCVENPKDYSISLRIIDDSTVLCRNCVRDTPVVLRKFADLDQGKNEDCTCYGLPCYFTRKYFAGRFRLSRPAGAEPDPAVPAPDSILEFTDCGVSGFGEFNRYQIDFDGYMAFTSLDVVDFTREDGPNAAPVKLRSYHFKVSGDSISLYDFDPPYDSIAKAWPDPDVDAKIGKLMYVLEKVARKNHPP